jgi:ATP-dependent RNA helicase SUPV3L1/SUV3
VLKDVRELSKEDRSALRSCGVRIGAETLFVPSLVKPKSVQWRAMLWKLFNDRETASPPGAGLVTVPAGDDLPEDFLEACGYAKLGGRAVRIDVLDRVAIDLQRQSRAGKMDIGAAQLNLLGLSMEAARPVFEGLGYVAEEAGEELVWKWVGRRKPKSERPKHPKRPQQGRPERAAPKPRKPVPKDENSPFAKLRDIKFS